MGSGEASALISWCCDSSVTVLWRCHGVSWGQNLSCFFKEKRLQCEIATLLVIRLGLEPKTPTLKVLCSTNWASGSLPESGCKGTKFIWNHQMFFWFFWIIFYACAKYGVLCDVLQRNLECRQIYKVLCLWVGSVQVSQHWNLDRDCRKVGCNMCAAWLSVVWRWPVPAYWRSVSTGGKDVPQ